jgi:thioredoxin reductase
VTLDVVIVGAGPAGLSAALILGRCRRRVLLIDTNRPRNAKSRALHGFLTRDGIAPRVLRRIGREQLAQYETVRFARLEAVRARRIGPRFELVFSDGTRQRCRKLLLATGVIDELPPVAGVESLYGRSVFHCPYCDGWEFRDQPMAIYARDVRGVGLAVELKVWSDDLLLCTNGAVRLSPPHVRQLSRHGIQLRQERISRLEGANGQLQRIVFSNGESVDRTVLFFQTGQQQQSELAASLGCTFTRKGAVSTGKYEVTNIPGLYVAGDASGLVQLAIVAASEGAQAAFAINTALMKEDLR